MAETVILTKKCSRRTLSFIASNVCCYLSWRRSDI